MRLLPVPGSGSVLAEGDDDVPVVGVPMGDGYRGPRLTASPGPLTARMVRWVMKVATRTIPDYPVAPLPSPA
jgi:hypothetical protein